MMAGLNPPPSRRDCTLLYLFGPSFNTAFEIRGPYLTHVKSLTSRWRHLQLLADFMDVGTHPIRWNPQAPGAYPADPLERSTFNLPLGIFPQILHS